MRRIRLKVAYDGTAYHGWQIQKNQITIEGKLNEAISNLLSAEINVIGPCLTAIARSLRRNSQER